MKIWLSTFHPLKLEKYHVVEPKKKLIDEHATKIKKLKTQNFEFLKSQETHYSKPVSNKNINVLSQPIKKQKYRIHNPPKEDSASEIFPSNKKTAQKIKQITNVYHRERTRQKERDQKYALIYGLTSDIWGNIRDISENQKREEISKLYADFSDYEYHDIPQIVDDFSDEEKPVEQPEEDWDIIPERPQDCVPEKEEDRFDPLADLSVEKDFENLEITSPRVEKNRSKARMTNKRAFYKKTFKYARNKEIERIWNRTRKEIRSEKANLHNITNES